MPHTKPAEPGKRGGENAIEFEGIPSSAEIRQLLIDSGEDVLLAFSGGKDSLAAWLALLDSGMPPERIIPYHMYGVPDLKFVNDSMDYFEQKFQTRIIHYPNPMLYHRLNNGTFQTQERMEIIEAAQLPNFDFPDVIAAIHKDLGFTEEKWKCDGVRATDSIVRRIAIKDHGPMKHHSRKVSPVWDWRISDVRNAMAFHDVKWPIDYEWFGRSFDGLDYRFLKPIKDNAPEDYEKLLDWHPLLELELIRYEQL